ncbi:MAG: cell division/cell wall cluster transcriptional repressor MraZ [Clostridia bacterium]|nr:cell division/cell wall cluster transcriptional repressor MraZ [Clostridia bacterium]MBQ8340283.1 cell division/cell wall cluster transcriptional repressor MraZ [Clostridia bacterium]
MLSGEYRHSLDAKNRVSIPAKLREELGENFMIVRSVRGTCLRFYSAEAWKEYIEPLKKLPRKVAEDTFWFLYRDAAQVTPDSLGRVLLPNGLLDFAKIGGEDERNLVIVGCGDFGEIWSEKLYDERVSAMDLDAIRAALEESGL